MNLKINRTIHEFSKLSYASHDMTIPEGVVDCSAGFNPYGTPPKALTALGELTPQMICEYPHGEFLKEGIIDFWKPNVELEKENIQLTNGTIDGIYLINTLFSVENAKMLTIAPQFSDYTTHAKFLNIAYVPVSLKKENNYRFDVTEVLTQMDGSFGLIYLDNPNNPTGQNISLQDLRQILDLAKTLDICVISDEAYGDFMEEKDSAAVLLSEYDNLVVLRTFSKGMGLAGMRCGYILSSKEICDDIDKISNPYTVTQPSRLVATAALKEKEFVSVCRTKIAKNKQMLRTVLGDNLSMAHTLDSCPICLLTHKNPDLDLEKEFLKRNVLTYSGSSFDGIGKNSVRLRLPNEKECAVLFQVIGEIGTLD